MPGAPFNPAWIIAILAGPTFVITLLAYLHNRREKVVYLPTYQARIERDLEHTLRAIKDRLGDLGATQLYRVIDARRKGGIPDNRSELRLDGRAFGYPADFSVYKERLDDFDRGVRLLDKDIARLQSQLARLRPDRMPDAREVARDAAGLRSRLKPLLEDPGVHISQVDDVFRDATNKQWELPFP